MTRKPLPRSLYAETARPAVATPPLDGDRRVDVCVIGGGFTGLSTALHLAQQGVDVAVLEAHEPGWGASGRNGGQVNPGLKHDPDQVEADFGADLGRRMVALSGDAPNVVFRLIERHQIECDALQSGTLRAAFGVRDAAGIRASAEQWMRRDAPVELLESDAAREVTDTDRYVCAMLDRRGGQVNPLGYARGLAQAAMQAGAAVHGDDAGSGGEAQRPPGMCARRPAPCAPTSWCWRPMATPTMCGQDCAAALFLCSARSWLANRCRGHR